MNYMALLSILLVFLSVHSFAGQINYSISFNESDFTFRVDNGFDKVEHPDCDFYNLDGDPGAPQVLRTAVSFIIPRDEGVLSITINYSSVKQFTGSYNLFPVQSLDYYSIGDTIWIDPDPSYYGNNDPYPNQIVNLGGTGYFDGANHIATVEIYPVFYHALDGDLFYYSDIDFTVNTGGASSQTPIYAQNRMRDDQYSYDMILENTVKNPQDIPLYGYKPTLVDTAIVSDIPYPSGYSYIIVTRDSLKEYWNPFIEWLNRKGKRASVITIENIVQYNIVDDPMVEDDSDLLRGYLEYTWNRGTVWVLLGGVCDMIVNPTIDQDGVNVPLRYYIVGNYDDYQWVPNQSDNWRPADIYFSEFQVDWEIDGDGYPGEQDPPESNPALGGDGLGFYGLSHEEELFMGRLPVVDGNDINRWIRKILNYEQNPGNGDYSYLFTAVWDLADGEQGGNYHLGSLNEFPERFTHVVYREIPEWNSPSPTDPKAEDIIDAMNLYPAFSSFHTHGSAVKGYIRTNEDGPGHGDRSSVVCCNEYPAGCRPEDSYCYISDLTNIDKPGILYSSWPCEQGGFDIGYDLGHHCIGMEYIFTDGGGTAFIGNTRHGWSPSSSVNKRYFVRYIFSGITYFPIHARFKIGPAKNWATRITNPRNRILACYTVFGSPEQDIWFDDPTHFEVQPDYAEDGVTVTAGGAPIEGALVCFSSKDYTKYYTAYTDQTGYAGVDPDYQFDVDEGTHITVTKQNYIPYQIIGNGDMVMDMTWRGDITFYGILEIPLGKTLRVKPGTNIKLDGSQFIVNGDLIIEGSAENKVIMTSLETLPAPGDWLGIKVNSTGTLDMAYCNIEYATNGILSKHSSFINLEKSNISYWVNYGIQCKNIGTVKISGNDFKYGGTKAIDIIGGDPKISDNSIVGSDFGITYQGGGQPTIESNKLEGELSSQIGIKVTRYDLMDVPKPIIINNVDSLFDYGLMMTYCSNDPSTIIKGNRFAKNRFAGLVVTNNPDIVGGSYISGEFNEFSDNDKWGISIGSGTPFISQNAIKRNGEYAIRTYLLANPNFGDLLTPGNNSIDGFVYDGYNTTFNTISAVGNYWHPRGRPTVFGSWDTSNPLASDPYFFAKPEGEITEIPREFKLRVNYPNPFNPATTISFDLPRQQIVDIVIFNILGQRVRTLTSSAFPAGTHSITWDGRNEKGIEVGSGIYLYQFSSEDYSDSKKMSLIR